MGNCEICGRETELLKCEIEGCEMSVCEKCSKFGKVTERISAEVHETRFNSPRQKANEEELAIINAASKVKNAREKKGLTQVQLAKAIAEKESVIHRIESGSTEPSMETARKLERFLGIKLIESVSSEQKAVKRDEDDAGVLTIGDLLRKNK